MKNVFTPLTLEQIRKDAPTAFQTKQKKNLSEHYVHIPTDRVINDMISLGWEPCQAVEVKARKKNTKGYQRHMIKFFNPSIVIEGPNGDNVYPQILLTNSHDGLSSFKFQIGLFRLVCSNGLVVMDTSYGDFKLRHMGYTFEELQTKINETVSEFPGLVKKINEFQQTELSDIQITEFAGKAAMIRFGENVSVDLDELLIHERKEDEGSNLWVVFNRVQEKLITGGCNYQTGNKIRKARAIKNFSMDLKINEALWELAEEYVMN
jgi:hypothetical protein